MKKIILTLALALPLTTMAQTPTTEPVCVPEVATWTKAEGYTDISGRVICKNKALRTIAEQLASDLRLIGFDGQVATGSAKAGDIVLNLKADKKAKAESYKIETGKTVIVTAASVEGVRWATQTILQQLPNCDASLLQGTIEDAPQYPLRGFMIDCGRKFFPISYLKQLIRDMAYFKMNCLQIHLNDNGFNYWFGDDWDKTQQAFRMESDYFPGLTAKDGHYTKQEMRDLIHYANNLGVEIIPEIDVPAHALSFTRFRPSLAKPEFGMDHLDITDPKVVAFIDSVFTEYISGPDPVFCCKRVHIGTDEFNNKKPEYREAFRSLTDHLIRLVEKHGKQAVCWGSLSHAYGETPIKVDNVIMSMWSNGFAKPKDMKEAGYKMISIPDGYVYIVPAAGYYYDYLNCERLYDSWTPANIGGTQFDECDPSIIGGMFAVWNDHPGNGITVQDVHDRVFDAMPTMATKCWSGATVKADWATFKANSASVGEAPGIDAVGHLIGHLEAKEVKPGTDRFVQKFYEPFKGENIDCVVDRGYPYEVTFTVDCKPEQKGTVLLSSPNANFYLSDPLQGKVGFEHEGYVHVFGYRLPKEGTVTLTIKGDNNTTVLYVNGVVKSRLTRETLHVLAKDPRSHVLTLEGSNAIVADATFSVKRMYYMHTLFFPLAQTGTFNSTVRDFKLTGGE